MSRQQHFPLTYLTFFLFLFFLPSYPNHHSPPSLAGSNSLSSLACKGPPLSSLRKALIRSATLNKERTRERGRDEGRKWFGKTEQRLRRSGVNQSGVRGCEGPRLGCVWSVSFKGGTAGEAITDDLPLADGPGATLTESNHKQVNSTSTCLIFFPCLLLLVSFCRLRWRAALPATTSTSLFYLLFTWGRQRRVQKCSFPLLFNSPQTG